jgi:signal transduction histidine kinase
LCEKGEPDMKNQPSAGEEEKKPTYEELLALNQRLLEENQSLKDERQRNQIMAEAIKSFRHDLRNPLSIITGCSGYLIEMAGSLSFEKYREFVEMILRNASALERMNSSHEKVEEKLLKNLNKRSLNQLVELAKERHQGQSEQNNVRWEVNIPEGILIEVADHSAVSAISHLLSNALHFSIMSGGKNPPLITINAAVLESHVTLTVTDTGTGFTEDSYVRATEKGYSSKNTGGHGLAEVTLITGKKPEYGNVFDAEGKVSGAYIKAEFRMIGK